MLIAQCITHKSLGRMTFRRVFYLHTRQISLGIARTIAIHVHIAGTLDTVPLAIVGWTLVTNLVVSRQTLQAS
jgi:hypothetical protein